MVKKSIFWQVSNPTSLQSIHLSFQKLYSSNSRVLKQPFTTVKIKLLLLSRFSRVRLCATPRTAAHQAPPPLGVWEFQTSGKLSDLELLNQHMQLHSFNIWISCCKLSKIVMQLVFKQTNRAEKSMKTSDLYCYTNTINTKSCQKLNKASAFKKEKKNHSDSTICLLEIPFCEFPFVWPPPEKANFRGHPLLSLHPLSSTSYILHGLR